jgi:hypothetical protein
MSTVPIPAGVTWEIRRANADDACPLLFSGEGFLFDMEGEAK